MEFEELKKMTVAQLREVAEGLEGLTGFTQMNKPHLLEAICEHENIDMHAHHDVVGVDKRGIKKRIAALKVQRAAALESKNAAELKLVRRKIHRLKRKMRRAMV